MAAGSRLIALICVALFCLEHDGFAADFSPLGVYSTPTGQVLSLMKSGSTIEGTLIDPEKGTLSEVRGVNKIRNKIELFREYGNTKEYIGAYNLRRVTVEDGSTFAMWTSSESSSIPEFASIILGNADIEDPTSFSSENLYISELVRASNLSQGYFDSIGLNAGDGRDLYFEYFSGSNNAITATADRKDWASIIATGWKEDGTLEGAMQAVGIDVRTLGETATSARLGKQAWDLVWAEADNRTDYDVTTASRIGIGFIPSRNTSERVIYINKNRNIYKKLLEKDDSLENIFASLTFFFNKRCIYSRNEWDINIVCDHHSSKYGMGNPSAWMKTQVSVIISSSIYSNTSDKIRIVLVPTSLVASRKDESQYDQLLSADFKKDIEYKGYWNQQNFFLDKIEEIITIAEAR